MPDTYRFRRLDDEETICVSFETMMTQDAAGFIEVDGVAYKRVHARPPSLPTAAPLDLNKPIISDALGFPEAQLADFEADRVANGFSGIEFIRDPGVPQFFQVKITSMYEWAKYIKHRGLRDKNSRNGGGACPSVEEFKRLQEEMLEKYPVDRQILSY